MPDLIWIQADEPLPSTHLAWDAQSPAPGLLAASHELSVTRLLEAYSLSLIHI
jgi:leucyl/phenylalanyl-tRNA--protein transferase